MGGLWRLYRGIATVVFTVELAFVLWLVLGLTGAGALFDRLFQPPATPAPVARTATPAVGGLPLLAASPGTQFTVEMTEAEINAGLARQQGRVPGVKDVTVQLLPGQVKVSANIVEPVQGAVQATGGLVAVGGRLRLVLTEARVGPLPLPGPAVDLLERYANDALDQALAGRNLYVEEVAVQAGWARVTARGNGP
ncbi:MAG: hypothetical protein ACYC3S_07470 [Chloroflexota bacterium]